MEKTKKTSVYLEPIHFKYLDLMSVITGLNKSQLIRDMIDNGMSANKEIIKTYEQLLFKTL
ncbi:hypothetical protein [Neobacillus mesonae]|uniref:hypothetical protein n=1 Tax=Neobacillus mesonae TaxID=1193713 RepID=UPI002572951C|nr:hypothetical protein [Neobacillus mesonae]